MSKDKLIPEIRFPEFKNEGEWDKMTIEDIAISESSSMALNKLELKSQGYPVYGADSIVGYIDEFQQNEKYISIVKDGSGVGRLNLCQRQSSILGTLACIKSKNEKQYHLDWIYYLLNKVDFTVYVKGAGIPHIYFSDFKKENVPVPKPKEQQKIASCLSSLDEVIAAHSQKLELLKDHKKGLMQNLFPQEGEKVPKYRFKEFEKDGEWELKQLGVDKVIEIKGRIGYRGYTIEDIVSKGDGAISMSPSNIDENGNLNFEKSTSITWAKYDESPEIMLEDGFTVLVKTGSSYGKAAYINNLIEKTTINPQLVVLKPKKIDSYFLYLLVTNTSIQKQIQETVVGGAIPTLSQDSISKFEVLVPKRKEQEKIASCLLTLNQLIISQTEKIEQLKLHKKGLMQGMFPKMKE
jgi:type I restriction enzyme S subunit